MNRQVRAYATGLFHRPVADNARALAEEAAGYAAGGFRAMKMKVGFGLAEDVRCVRAVRDAIGPDCLLAMDANEAYRAGVVTSPRFAKQMETTRTLILTDFMSTRALQEKKPLMEILNALKGKNSAKKILAIWFP